ncbi:ferrochelatase [Serratia microhaemolytica]|uniref:ferrochelatase n=1 Tax=Serratia microhaemolytica TaxID=2675110 RepID=UPI000FDE5AA8|nr:ferrochelatase [Serratia microhaemolytica]
MKEQQTGVLLVNLGTPDEPTPRAIKRYLKQFLSDRRVVDLPRLLWWPILNGIILPRRAARVAKLYQEIWMEQGSPLLVYSRRQQQRLAAQLGNIPVVLGMSYGSPSLASALDELLANKLDALIILPLYPQYSCSTSAAVWDAIAERLKQYRRLPSIHFIRDYADHPAYIAALKHSVMRAVTQHGIPDCLLVSFHGIPQRYANQGDDYPQRCEATFQALATELDLTATRLVMSYQSRFGREPWLLPNTDETIAQLATEGVRHIQVICPGFSADCLETLEEINQQNRQLFVAAGGERFEYIPALNDDDAHIALLQQLVMQQLERTN